MPTLSYLPEWTVNYSYNVSLPIVRTVGPGKKNQAKKSHRHIYTAPAERILQGAQLPYFEHFVRNVCNEGASKFTDYYRDGNGSQQGDIRIVNGEYTVTFLSSKVYRISCEIEVFR